MPQFDVSYYLGEMFWMLVSFGFLYFVMASSVCPALEKVFRDREKKVQTELEKAEKFNNKADELIKRHEAFMEKLEKQQAEKIQEAYQKIQKQAFETERKNDVLLREKVAAAEEKMTEALAKFDGESNRVSDKIARQISRKFKGVRK